MNPRRLLVNSVRIVAGGLAGVSLMSVSYAQSAGLNGCQQARDFTAVAEVYSLTNASEGGEMLRQIRSVRTRACAGEFGASDTVRYPNGQTATNYAGSDSATWYWPNGRTITNYALSKTATVYYPNGQTVSNYFRQLDATFRYANGQTMTSYAGRKGATIYSPSGSTLSSSAPSFSRDGDLDVESLLTYVSDVAGGQPPVDPPPANCSRSEMKSMVERAIEYVRAPSSESALRELRKLRECL